MSPLVHGRIFPEVESSGLVRRELRVLIDPTTIRRDTVAHLIDLDVLRQYLRDLTPEPCRVTLLAPTAKPELRAQYEALERVGGEVLPYGSIVLPEVADALGNADGDFVGLASAATAADADVVVTETTPAGLDLGEITKKLHILFGDWPVAKRNCEIFARGHEVPWSFARPAWYSPWTPFYSLAEPDTKLILLWEKARAAGIAQETLELTRSLALNRHAALSYSRDKLLFYVQQERGAKRHRLERQNFAFEAGYFLNHYYVLFWAGLDQINWIVNDIFNLPFRKKDWRRVGTLNRDFLVRMRERAPKVADVYEDGDFIRWIKMLRGARHFVAHEGFSMPGELYIRSGDDPTDAEVDVEIEQSNEWRELEQMFPRDVLESFRPTFRDKARLRRHRKVEARFIKIEMDGQEVLITPLTNIEWDFNNFFGFAHKVADLAIERLGR